MSHGLAARLARRGVVAVGGDEAEQFLNGLVSVDVAKATPGRAVYAGLLSPQGKVLFDFIAFRDHTGFLLDLARTASAEFIRRLLFYRLRAKVTVDDFSADREVIAGWGDGKPQLDVVATDPRLAQLGWRAIVPAGASVPAGSTQTDEAAYDAHRIDLGVPEGGIDFTFGEAFPHDVDMDQLGGVDFAKGCFVGQEVVSRMEHRGTARRRVVIVRGRSPLPPAGTAIAAAGPPVGTLMSSAGETGLALVRLDRAKEASDAGQTITVGTVAIELMLPPWAKFGWPDGVGQD